jgi:hypothetical protein
VQVGGGDLTRRRGNGPQRAQHPARHQPAQADGEHRHPGQREPGLDEQLAQLGRVLMSRLRFEPACLRQRLTGSEAAAAASGDLQLWRLPAVVCGGPIVRSANDAQAAVLPLEDDSVGGADDQDVGDGQQDGTGEQEQPAVEQGEPQPHGAPRQAAAGGQSGEPTSVHGHPQIR